MKGIFIERKPQALRQLLLPGSFNLPGWGLSVISSILLMCAVFASLGVGVLLAYGICLSMLRLFRIHATQVAARRIQILATGSLRVIGN